MKVPGKGASDSPAESSNAAAGEKTERSSQEEPNGKRTFSIQSGASASVMIRANLWHALVV